MTGELTHIVRHPIKSIGWEVLGSVELTAGSVLPNDRRWAIAHEAATFSGTPDGWHPKRNFVRGVAGPQLMSVEARLSEDERHVALSHPNRPDIRVAPDLPEDAAALLEWISPLWPDSRPAVSRVVAVDRIAMTDVPDPFVAILSKSSLRALGEMAGSDLSIHRFRGNLWLDGFAPWEEADWMGKVIGIGSVRLRVEQPITRCNATKVNPETGQPDVDTLGVLKEAFGHQDFGVYATVLNGGSIANGDEAEIR